MTHELSDPAYYLKWDPEDKDENTLSIYELTVPNGTATVKVAEADFEVIETVKFNPRANDGVSPLKVGGHPLTRQQFVRLARRLNTVKMAVNNQGLCYLEANDGYYYRMFDHFNWASYGVKNITYHNFLHPKDHDGKSSITKTNANSNNSGSGSGSGSGMNVVSGGNNNNNNNSSSQFGNRP